MEGGVGGEVVGTAAPVSLEVEGDVLIAEALEFLGNASGGGRIEEAREFGGADFNTGEGGAQRGRSGLREIVEVWRGLGSSRKRLAGEFVVADTHVEKAEIAQQILGGFDHLEFLFCNGLAVGDARTEASHLGLVGGGEAKTGG